MKTTKFLILNFCLLFLSNAFAYRVTKMKCNRSGDLTIKTKFIEQYKRDFVLSSENMGQDCKSLKAELLEKAKKQNMMINVETTSLERHEETRKLGFSCSVFNIHNTTAELDIAPNKTFTNSVKHLVSTNSYFCKRK